MQDKKLQRICKRLIDIIVSVAAIVILFPLWVFIAIAIKVTSPGSVLYKTQTVGKGGDEFTIYKFRTMYTNNDDTIHRVFIENYVKNNQPFSVVGNGNGKGKRIYKVINDHRVTHIGGILRRTGLDELPQFFNVIRGEMSIVGPRSPRPFEFIHYENWHKKRIDVLPGITGLYQVTARSMVPFDKMVKLDLEYIEKWSLWLDIKIMVKTIPVMIMMKGGY